MESSSSTWMTGRPFRIFVLLLGVVFFAVYGAMFIVVGINLPDSWIGLTYVIVGLAGAVACIQYFRNQSRMLLVPISAALVLLIAGLVGTLLFGQKIDENLQVHRLQNTK